MTSREIFSLSLDIGQEIIRAGGEIHRARDTIIRINNAYDNKCTVFALPNLLIAQCLGKTEIRHIAREETDLAELARLNALSRKLCSNPYDEILITKNNKYGRIIEFPSVFIATFSFCLFFGGGLTDALFSGFIGLAITILGKLYSDKALPVFAANIIEAFAGGCLSYLPALVGLFVSPDKIIIGTIMVLVPGLTVVNAMRDLMNGDLVAGLIELCSAVMSALAIAFGVAGAVYIFDGNR